MMKSSQILRRAQAWSVDRHLAHPQLRQRQNACPVSWSLGTPAFTATIQCEARWNIIETLRKWRCKQKSKNCVWKHTEALGNLRLFGCEWSWRVKNLSCSCCCSKLPRALQNSTLVSRPWKRVQRSKGKKGGQWNQSGTKTAHGHTAYALFSNVALNKIDSWISYIETHVLVFQHSGPVLTWANFP